MYSGFVLRPVLRSPFLASWRYSPPWSAGFRYKGPFLALGSWFPFLVPFLITRSWFLVPGSWFLVLGSPSTRFVGGCSCRFLVFFPDLRPSFLVGRSPVGDEDYAWAFSSFLPRSPTLPSAWAAFAASWCGLAAIVCMYVLVIHIFDLLILNFRTREGHHGGRMLGRPGPGGEG